MNQSNLALDTLCIKESAKFGIKINQGTVIKFKQMGLSMRNSTHHLDVLQSKSPLPLTADATLSHNAENSFKQKPIFAWWVYLESLWCGDSLLSSKLCLPFCKDAKEMAPLVRGHLFSMLSSFVEIGALILLLIGAFLNNMPLIVVGASAKMLSHLFGGWTHNASAAFLSLWSLQFFDRIIPCQRQLHGCLHQQGMTDSEIAALPTLFQELYQTELHNVPNALLLHILTPLVSMGVLWIFGEWMISLSIGLLGCAAFPLSNWFYQQFHFGHNRLLRFARTASAYRAIQNYYTRHVSLTTRVNAIGQLPLFLFAMCMSLGAAHSPFAHYLAFTLGLGSLSGLLAFQRTRLHTQQTIKRAEQVLNTLGGAPFLFSQDAIQHHISVPNYNKELFKGAGIFVDQLCPIGMNQIRALSPVTFFIPNGGVCILQAPSGYGKSLLVSALLHLVDHSGDVWVCGESTYNIHALPARDWPAQFSLFCQEDLPGNVRLIDLFAPVLRNLHDGLWQRLVAYSESLAQMVFFGSDVLFEQELSYSKCGKCSLFPAEMDQELRAFRSLRMEWLTALLRKLEFPLNIHSERVFGTLSPGEKRRVLNLLTIVVAEHCKRKLIILDEPLAHLDVQAIEQQVSLLQQAQERLQTPILLITHHHVRLLVQSLKQVECLSLESTRIL